MILINRSNFSTAHLSCDNQQGDQHSTPTSRPTLKKNHLKFPAPFDSPCAIRARCIWRLLVVRLSRLDQRKGRLPIYTEVCGCCTRRSDNSELNPKWHRLFLVIETSVAPFFEVRGSHEENLYQVANRSALMNPTATRSSVRLFPLGPVLRLRRKPALAWPVEIRKRDNLFGFNARLWNHTKKARLVGAPE